MVHVLCQADLRANGRSVVTDSNLIVLAILAVPLAGVAVVVGWSRWRMWCLLRQPFPVSWDGLLRSRLPPYDCLDDAARARLQRLIRQFLFRKKFFGCGGLEVTDEMRLLIAAQACLLLLNRPGSSYPRLRFILVYPDAFIAPRVEYLDGGVEVSGEHDLEGESWGNGKVILSWEDIARDLADFGDGRNVVLHEFAHQLDEESEGANGAPLLGSGAAYDRWAAAMKPAFERLQLAAASAGAWGGLLCAVGEARRWPSRCPASLPALDPYGATSPAEFFAVATETFFEKPEVLARSEPDVFVELLAYYRIDPRRWR